MKEIQELISKAEKLGGENNNIRCLVLLKTTKEIANKLRDLAVALERIAKIRVS